MQKSLNSFFSIKHKISKSKNIYQPECSKSIRYKFQGFKDLSKEPRYKFWTFGEDNTVTLGCQKARNEDEGDYKVSIFGQFSSLKNYKTVQTFPENLGLYKIL